MIETTILQKKLEEKFKNVRRLESIRKPRRFNLICTLNTNGSDAFAVAVTRSHGIPVRFVYNLARDAFTF